MTEFDNTGDGWARGVFDRARTGDEPHWLPDAAGASRLSARHRFRVRAAGALSVAAVVGASATAYATLGGRGGGSAHTVSPAASSDPASPIPATKPPADVLELSKYLMASASGTTFGSPDTQPPSDGPGGPAVPTRAVPVLASIVSALDPGHPHLRSGPGQPINVSDQTGDWKAADVQATGWWTPDGDSKPVVEPGTDEVPLGEVYIAIHSSARNTRSAIPNSPCGIDAAQAPTARTLLPGPRVGSRPSRTARSSKPRTPPSATAAP